MVEALGAEVIVRRNDKITTEEIGQFDKIILSPGPGLPHEAVGMMNCIERWYDKRPILGVCLGMQALATYFDDRLVNQKKVTHGMQMDVHQLNESKLLVNLPDVFPVGLYHSWSIESSENSPFIITSKSTNGVIMSFEHKNLPLYGVQFHPESILTPDGRVVLRNFLEI